MIKYTKTEVEKYEEVRILIESQPSTSLPQQEEDKNKKDDKYDNSTNVI